MSHLPVRIDLDDLLKRLAREEKAIHARLAGLEAEIRRFEDVERPAYDQWLRLELGPRIVTLEEILSQIHERRILVNRLNELIETQGLHPREALYVLRNLAPEEPHEFEEEQRPRGHTGKKSGWDEAEIEARRQAKREAKREARRENKKAKKQEDQKSPHWLARRLTSLYRELAKKLHPDSPAKARSIPETRLMNIWMEVQKAYETGNLERMASISIWLSAESGEELPHEKNVSYEERLNRLRALKKTCKNLEEKIDRLGGHPAWGFGRANPQQKRKIRQRALRALDEEIGDAQEILSELDDLLDSVGPPRAPRRKMRR